MRCKKLGGDFDGKSYPYDQEDHMGYDTWAYHRARNIQTLDMFYCSYRALTRKVFWPIHLKSHSILQD
jgi:hypothetical protein